MTIIEPKKNKSLFSYRLLGLFLLLLFLVYGNVYLYNQTVDLRHILSDKSEELQTLKVANADMKNQFYLSTDSQKLSQLAEERGLIKIKSPQYIEINDLWLVVSASHY